MHTGAGPRCQFACESGTLARIHAPGYRMIYRGGALSEWTALDSARVGYRPASRLTVLTATLPPPHRAVLIDEIG